MNAPTRLDKITVGADPEFFLSFKGSPVPAYYTGIEGTKDKPTPLKTGGGVQVDGMALEFNIPPVTNGKDFYDIIKETLFEIRKMVDKDLEFVFRPEVTFREVDFKNTPSKYKELGCDPDYDAWRRGIEKTPPQGSGDKPFRTAGGHLHYGWMQSTSDFAYRDPRNYYDCNYIVQGLEQSNYYLLEYDQINYPNRSQLYGSRGSYRPKPYGVEWRTPSNMWLNFPQDTIMNMINSHIFVINQMLDKRVIDLNYKSLVEMNTHHASASQLVYNYYRYYNRNEKIPIRQSSLVYNNTLPQALDNMMKDMDSTLSGEVKLWNNSEDMIKPNKTRNVA